MRRFPSASAAAVALILIVCLAAPLLPLPDPLTMDFTHRFAMPSAAHWLGQDEVGRDLLARLIHGARTSLAIALSATLIACLLGSAIGVMSGYLRGVTEFLSVRAMDIILCFPPLLIALLMVTLLDPGSATIIPVLAVVYLPGFVRVAHAGVLTIRAQQYVEAVQVAGAGTLRIAGITILPNIAGPLLVQFSLTMAAAIVLESGLSFLGLGVVPPTPSLGLMISTARTTMEQAPQLLVWPCFALALVILTINWFCDGLRDYLDPHGRTVRRRRWAPATTAPRLPAGNVVLAVEGLTLGIKDGTYCPVRDVSFSIRRGETVAVVGESGSGKSLTSLAVLGLLPTAIVPQGGSIWLERHEVLRLPEARLRALRGRSAAMIFQNPMSSLNELHSIRRQIGETLRAHGHRRGGALRQEAVGLLRRVGIPDPERRVDQYPHQMSGGMCQRVMIAIAMANRPRLLIADEPTTALDVTIQAQILEMLEALKREDDLALLFISHSLPVVAQIADRVVVMYAGEVLEEGPTRAVFAAPRHPYTVALLASAPREDGPPPSGIPGNVPNAAALPPGCVFAPRCGHHQPECDAGHPTLEMLEDDRSTRCIRWRNACPTP